MSTTPPVTSPIVSTSRWSISSRSTRRTGSGSSRPSPATTLETDSAVAARLLATWEDALGDFVKVMPRDYRRVLEATRRAVDEGVSVDVAVMAAPRA